MYDVRAALLLRELEMQEKTGYRRRRRTGVRDPREARSPARFPALPGVERGSER